MTANRVESAVDRIKASITIGDVAARLMPEWRPAKACSSPFRADKNASFSVFDNCRKWKDHATDESGDVIDFFCKARACDIKTAIMEMSTWAGLATPPAPRKSESAPLRLPALRKGAADEIGTLARLRRLSAEGLHLASERGLLFFADIQDEGKIKPCWIVTDSRRVCAQARRLDGQPMTTKGGQRIKAKTLPGSKQSWPIGLPQCENFSRIMLVEGGPDLLAAHHFIHAERQEDHIGAVAMLGASNSIPANALPLFAGKSIRIFPHLDQAGQQAAARWESQLHAAGAAAHCFSLADLRQADGKPVKDLNDLSNVHADDFENDRALWALTCWEGGL